MQRRSPSVERAGEQPDEAEEEEGGPWQGASGRGEAVVRAVLERVAGAELARCGGVCRAWRRLAAEPALWRRLLRDHRPRRLHATTAALLAPLAAQNESETFWREEYVRSTAAWRLEASVPVASDALTHAALSHAGTLLALTAHDASVAVWAAHGDSWAQRWRRRLDERGWCSVARAQWAPGDARLLLAGPLALADRWELLVLQLTEEGAVTLSRASCSGGAAGCWAGADAFLALELRLLAPAQAITAVWLNAATQETHSEYAGVTTRLLQIYNEGAAHISHVVVAEAPLEADADDMPPDTQQEEIALSPGLELPPGVAYYRTMRSEKVEVTVRMLVAAFGAGSGGGSAVRVWPLTALQPPPLLADESVALAERARRRREHLRRLRDLRDLPEPEPEPDLDEAAVRALCTPPHASRLLPAPPTALLLHHTGRCVWASSARGVCCVSLPTLQLLCALPAPAEPAPHRPLASHYVQSAHSDAYFASPGGGGSGEVWWWSVRSGARGVTPLRHRAPAVAVALPPPQRGRTRPYTALVVADDTLHVWRSSATPQSFDEAD